MAPQTIEDLLIAEAARIDALHGERRSHELVKFAIAAPAIAAIEHRLAQSLEVTEAEIELVQKRFGAVAASFLRNVKRSAAIGGAKGARLGSIVGAGLGSATGAVAGLRGGLAGTYVGAALGHAAGREGGRAVGAVAGAATGVAGRVVAPAVVRGSKALAGYYQRAKGKAGDLGAAAGEKFHVATGGSRAAIQGGRNAGRVLAGLKLTNSDIAGSQRFIADAAVGTRALGARNVSRARNMDYATRDKSGFHPEAGTPMARHVNNATIAGGASTARSVRGQAAGLGRKIATRAFDVAGGLTAAITGGAAAYGAYRAGKKDGRAGRDADGDGKKDESKSGAPIKNREGIAR